MLLCAIHDWREDLEWDVDVIWVARRTTAFFEDLGGICHNFSVGWSNLKLFIVLLMDYVRMSSYVKEIIRETLDCWRIFKNITMFLWFNVINILLLSKIRKEKSHRSNICYWWARIRLNFDCCWHCFNLNTSRNKRNISFINMPNI